MIQELKKSDEEKALFWGKLNDYALLERMLRW